MLSTNKVIDEKNKIIFENAVDKEWYNKHPNDFILGEDKEDPNYRIAVRKGENKDYNNPPLPIEKRGVIHLQNFR